MIDENTQIEQPIVEPPAGDPAPAPRVDDLNVPAKPAAPAPDAQPVPYAATGDAAMDVALDFFSKAGIKPDSPAALLAQKGDFSVLKAELAAKQKAGWEGYVAIAEQSFSRAASAAAAAAAATKATILSVAGSQEDWDAIRTFIGEKADPSELAEINAALKAGGVTAKATVRYMKDVFTAGGGQLTGAEPTVKDTPLVPATRAQQAPTNSALTAAQYNAEVQALRAKIGAARMDGSPEYASLRARRMAAMR